MRKNWDEVKERILWLYKRMGLPEVIKVMSEKHSFNASPRAYKTKIKEWGHTKNKARGSPANLQQRQPQSSRTSDQRPHPVSGNINPPIEVSHDTMSFGWVPSPVQNHMTLPQLNYVNPGPWTFTEPESHYPGSMESVFSVRSPAGFSLFNNSTPLASEGDSMSNTQDSNGRTPLHRAVINRSIKEVGKWLSSGAAVDIPDSNGDQPLHHAAAGSSQEITQLLLKYGADVDAKGHEGKSPLHMSVARPQMVKALLKSHPMVSSQDDNGDTPLHLAMVSSAFNKLPNGSIIEKLIEFGADVNVQNFQNIAPFHVALVRSRLERKYNASWVVMFLENGADIFLRAADGRLPFEIFLENAYIRDIKFADNNEPLGAPAQSFKLFVDKGASLNVVLKSGQPLVNDVLSGIYNYPPRDFWLAQFICEIADLTKAGASGCYPLHCLFGRFNMSRRIEQNLVKAMLSRGADPNQTNKAGQSPLILLFSGKASTLADTASYDMEIVEEVLKGGADPMLKDKSGNFPIYLAMRNYEEDVSEGLVKLLLKAMVSGDMPIQSSSGSSDQTDQNWFDKCRLFYRQAFWSSPAYLAESSYLLPIDIAAKLSKIAISLLAEKFLQGLQINVETARRKESIDYSEMKLKRNQLVTILQDCRSLGIEVDLSWFHLLLDLQE